MPDSRAKPYKPEPPRWRSLLHAGCDALSWPDYFLPAPHHPENDMSENQVRVGVSARQQVANENFSAHSLILNILPPLLPALNTLFVEVLRRRQFLVETHQLKPHAYRAPPRVTLNEAKLSAYVKDLADADVPLSRVARSLPHGFRGEKLLEMLWLGANPSTLSAVPSQAHANATRISQGLSSITTTPGASSSGQIPNSATSLAHPVPIDRAVWFVRAVGASDLANRSRGSTSLSPAMFTAEFTTNFVGWLKKQLADLTATSLQDYKYAGLDTESGQVHPMTQWSAKWRYSELLADALFEECLLDRRTWCKFVTQAFADASTAQLPVTLALVQSSFSYILRSDQLGRAVVSAACSHSQGMTQLKGDSTNAERVKAELEGVIRCAWDSNQETFVSFPLWHKHAATLVAVLSAGADQGDFAAMQQRSALRSSSDQTTKLIPPQDSPDIHDLYFELDRFDQSSKLQMVELAASSLAKEIGLESFVPCLIRWSCSAQRVSSSHWRPLLASTILTRVVRTRKGAGGRAGAIKARETQIEALVTQWLELNGSQADEADSIDFTLLVTLLSELSRVGLFSYPRWLQRISSKGATHRSASGNRSTSAIDASTSDNLQVRLLRSLPVHDLSPALQTQRRLAIYGPRATESREEAVHRRAVRELHRVFPLLSREPQSSESPLRLTEQGLRDALPHLWQASRFVSHRILTRQVLPVVLSWINTAPNHPVDTVAALLWIFRKACEWQCVADVVVDILDRFRAAQRHRDASGQRCTDADIGLLQLLQDAVEINCKELAALDSFHAINTGLKEARELLHGGAASRAVESFRQLAGRSVPATGGHADVTDKQAEEKQAQTFDLSPDDSTLASYWRKCGDLIACSEPPSVRDCVDVCLWYVSYVLQAYGSSWPRVDERPHLYAWFGFEFGKREAQGLVQICGRSGPATGDSCLSALLRALQKSSAHPRCQPAIDHMTGFVMELILAGTAQASALCSSLTLLLKSSMATGGAAGVAVTSALQALACLTSASSPTAAQVGLTIAAEMRAAAALSVVETKVILELCATMAVVLASEGGVQGIGSASQVLRHLSSLQHVRDDVTSDPTCLGDAAREALKGAWVDPCDTLQILYSCFSPSAKRPLLLRSALDIDVEDVLARMDDLCVSATIEELTFVFAELATVEASQQSKADGKVVRLAHALLPRLFLGADAPTPEGLRLWDLGGRIFRSATCEGLWRALRDATAEDSWTRAYGALWALLVHTGGDGSSEDPVQFPPCASGPLEELFVSVKDCFSRAHSDEGAVEEADAPALAAIRQQCRILHLLCFSPSLWSPTVRALVLDLDVSLLRTLVRYSLDKDDEEAACFAVLRDTISALHEAIPSDLHPPLSARISQHFSDLPEEFPERLAAPRCIESFCRLLPSAPTHRTGAEHLVMARSMRDAFANGEYEALPNNPWRWGEGVDGTAAAAATVKTAGERLSRGVASPREQTAPQESLTELWGPLTLPSITNNLSMSLDAFAPRRVGALASDPRRDCIAWGQRRHSTPAAEEDETWRTLPSERQMVLDPSIDGYAEAVRSGRRYVAPRIDSIGDGAAAVAGPSTSSSSSASPPSPPSLASLVGLPTGPVQTMAGYLESERQKRGAAKASAAESRRGSSGKAAGVGSSRKRKGSAVTTDDAAEAAAAASAQGSKRRGSYARRKGSTDAGDGSGRKRAGSNASSTGSKKRERQG